jgi:hypothetical protein
MTSFSSNILIFFADFNGQAIYWRMLNNSHIHNVPKESADIQLNNSSKL